MAVLTIQVGLVAGTPRARERARAICAALTERPEVAWAIPLGVTEDLELGARPVEPCPDPPDGAEQLWDVEP